MTQPVPPLAPTAAAELAPLLAELDRLSQQAAQLRQRIARLGAGASARPGWPIQRVSRASESAATRVGGGA